MKFIDDFDDIDNTPLEIETTKSDKVMDVIDMSEEQQIEWAKKLSLNSASDNTNDEDGFRKSNSDSSKKVPKQSMSRKTGINTGGTGDIDGGTGDLDDDIGHMDVDMDCSDEDLLTAYNETQQQQDNVVKDDVTKDSEVHGLKGGARIGDVRSNASIRQVTYISDDSDHSGLDTNEKTSKITHTDDDSDHSGLDTNNKTSNISKAHLVKSSDSSDTSFDECGGVKKRSKDNSLCSLMDRRPVLSKFSGDLLIESDSNDNTSRNKSRSFFSEKDFVKSAASPFNAKFQPPFRGHKSDSPQTGRKPLADYRKNEVRDYTPPKRDLVDHKSDSPFKQSSERNLSSRFDKSPQTARKPMRDYRRNEVRGYSSPKRNVVEPGFDEEEVARAIQRSLNDQVCILL